LQSAWIRSEEAKRRARKLIDAVVEHNVTKYNNSPDIVLPERGSNRRILVVDQTAGDNSIVFGQCTRFTFQEMLEQALQVPDAEVYLKLHPESVAGAKPANYDLKELQLNPRVRIVAKQCNVMSLIKQVDDVYVMTSGVGLEAIFAGRNVHCFGVPFYAGWGLTEDRASFANQRRPLSVEELFAGVFLVYTQFFHPETLVPCRPEECIGWIARERRRHRSPSIQETVDALH
jgi:capsular polysaccharide export protein